MTVSEEIYHYLKFETSEDQNSRRKVAGNSSRNIDFTFPPALLDKEREGPEKNIEDFVRGI